RRGPGGRGEQLPAWRLAGAAGLGADAAVLVHAGVLLALVPAHLAGDDAALKGGFDSGAVLPGAAAEDPAGSCTEISAVEVEPDARAQVHDHVFSHAGVGTGGAGLGTFKTRSDAVGELLHVQVRGVVGVGLDH